MVERKILYYPTILVPSSWLKWAILYWDKASSIIPSEWEEKPVLESRSDLVLYESMKYLGEEGLFEPTRPEHSYSNFREYVDNRALRKKAHEKVLSELKEFLKSPSFMSGVRRDWTKNLSYRIHGSKMSHETLAFLMDLKLVEKEPTGFYYSSWFFVEKNIYLLYMALLAKNLADIDADYTVSSTDWPQYETMVFESDDQEHGFLSLRTKFIDILPVPRDNVSIKDIVKFRKEKRNELLDFREILDALQKETSSAKSQAEVKQILLQYKERIERGNANLKNSMRESNIKIASSVLASLIDIKTPALLVETIGFSLARVPMEISIPAIVGTAAIQVSCALIDRRNEQTAKIRESPFSYLYHAEKKKII
jgi:hypothetical protein